MYLSLSWLTLILPYDSTCCFNWIRYVYVYICIVYTSSSLFYMLNNFHLYLLLRGFYINIIYIVIHFILIFWYRKSIIFIFNKNSKGCIKIWSFLDWKHERNEQALFLLGINALVLYAKAFPRSVENQKDARSLTRTYEAEMLRLSFFLSFLFFDFLFPFF